MADGVPFLNLAEIELAARERLAPLAYEYYVGGANDEVTIRENRAAVRAALAAVSRARRRQPSLDEHHRARAHEWISRCSSRRRRSSGSACDDGELAHLHARPPRQAP
jgi:hypothetical protein